MYYKQPRYASPTGKQRGFALFLPGSSAHGAEVSHAKLPISRWLHGRTKTDEPAQPRPHLSARSAGGTA